MTLIIGALFVVLNAIAPVISSSCSNIPPFLQGDVLTLTYIAGDTTSKPLVNQSSFTYDALGKRIYKNIVQGDGSSYQLIELYKQQKVYQILSDGTCKVFRLKDSFPLLQIPTTSNRVVLVPTVKVYSGRTQKGQFVISISAKQCLPISWTEYLPLGPRFLVKQRHFSHVTGRIDSTKFRPPITCMNARYGLAW